MSSLHLTNKAVRLPHSFQKVGLAVLLLALVPALAGKLGGVAWAPAQKELLRELSMNALIFGLLLVAVSKEKVETEKTASMRQNSMQLALLLAVLSVLLQPLLNISMKVPAGVYAAQDLVLTSLIVYLFFFYLQKKAR